MCVSRVPPSRSACWQSISEPFAACPEGSSLLQHVVQQKRQHKEDIQMKGRRASQSEVIPDEALENAGGDGDGDGDGRSDGNGHVEETDKDTREDIRDGVESARDEEPEQDDDVIEPDNRDGDGDGAETVAPLSLTALPPLRSKKLPTLSALPKIHISKANVPQASDDDTQALKGDHHHLTKTIVELL